MCQMTIVLEEEDGRTQTVLENASFLEAGDNAVTVGALFEEPKVVAGARVKRIDFMEGRVTLAPADPSGLDQ